MLRGITMTNDIQEPKPTTNPGIDADRVLEERRARFYRDFGLTASRSGHALADRRGPAGFLRAAMIDVRDTGKAFRIVAEIPGVPKELLDIRVRGSVVEIRGEQTAEDVEKDSEFVRWERTRAGFYRRLELPEAVAAAQAKCTVENGKLNLELPKVTRAPSTDEVKVTVD
jgi:HSP20 family protein